MAVVAGQTRAPPVKPITIVIICQKEKQHMLDNEKNIANPI
jgi:hypothetical protein